MDDLISRQAAISDVCFAMADSISIIREDWNAIIEALEAVPSEQQWIPCSERLPENTEPVNITWVNRKPEPYYADIKNKPFTATGHYHNGKWWWYSAVCQDYLDEYGKCEMDEMDRDIEVIAWMPLPEPYKEGEA